MKCIVLAKMSKRISAAVIDLTLFLAISLIVFFTAIFPTTFDKTSYIMNQNEIGTIFLRSDLYEQIGSNVVAKNGIQYPKTVKDFISFEKSVDGSLHKISCIDSLYTFYTDKITNFNKNKLTLENFNKDVLKVGTEQSNIASFTYNKDLSVIKLIDETKENKTISYLNDVYTTAIKVTTSFNKITDLNNKNSNLMLSGLIYIIPTLLVGAFIIYGLIPICSPNGETVGKWICKIGVLTKDGYRLNKMWYILRFLTLFVVEFALGIATMGGAFLISYMMFIFNKKRRCIHDFCSNSVVIDKTTSTWFISKAEQDSYYLSHGLGNE
ncbi:MAG: RDD family protein [Bacilli bacterium]